MYHTLFKLKILNIGTHFKQSRNGPQLLITAKNVSLVSHLTFGSIKVITTNNFKINSTKPHRIDHQRNHLYSLAHGPNKKLVWDPHEWSHEYFCLLEGGGSFNFTTKLGYAIMFDAKIKKSKDPTTLEELKSWSQEVQTCH